MEGEVPDTESSDAAESKVRQPGKTSTAVLYSQ